VKQINECGRNAFEVPHCYTLLLFVSVLSETFLSLMCRDFVSFSFFTARHTSSD
jgi:hypothetical protein